MLEESFLAEMNPGAEMARSQPENNAQAVTSKAELISDESGAYKELFGRGETVIRERTIVDYPGYPKYFDTGNPEMDDVAFKIAAEKWAAENAVEFQKISGLIQNSHP